MSNEMINANSSELGVNLDKKFCESRKIDDIVKELGLDESEVEYIGKHIVKVSLQILKRLGNRSKGKLVLVTAMTPTPAGEGKTTTTIGLADTFRKLGKKAIVCLREPSMGPVFGIKGGATGGGKACLVPAIDINLHFTGDIHAVGAAHNLLSALVANHVYFGNSLNIDLRRWHIRRVLDMNDRALRFIVAGLGGHSNGVPYETGFDITASSEVMAILCLSQSISELKNRLGKMIVGYNYNGEPVYAHQLNAQGAMAALLKEAIKPNLVQTCCGTPAFVHGGPFANIAHGCNSLLATKIALGLGEVVITEAGFGTDLGAEKFFNIKCRYGNLRPDCVVLVATIRAIKMHGGVSLKDLDQLRMEELGRGFENLAKHIENIKLFGVPLVVAINRFESDRDCEIEKVKEMVTNMGVRVAVSEVYSKGVEGGIELAKQVDEAMNSDSNHFSFLYPLEMPLFEKLIVIARCCYGANGVVLSKTAQEMISKIESLGYRNLPVCVAKTQASLSDNPNLIGRPKNFKININQVRLSSGAGFVVAIAGDIMTMPGLPKVPSAEKIDVLEDGTIIGL